MTGKRAYRSALREEQANITQARALDAARELFLAQGYGVTTLGQIASQAGVALPTLTGLFANKRTLLDEVLRSEVRGAGDEAPQSLREQVDYVLQAADPGVLLARMATLIGGANERAFGLFEILRKAAAADPEIQARSRAGALDRRRDQAVIARELARRGELRPGLSVKQATDILWLYSSSDVYRLLVAERRWSARQFEAWLRQTLIDALIDRGGA